MSDTRIVIIGNGITGATAACRLRELSDVEITMVSDEYPIPFARTALMYLFMGQVNEQGTHLHDRSFWQLNRIQLIQAKAEKLDRFEKMLHLSNGQTLHYDKLVIATGSRPILPDIDGLSCPQVHWLYHLSDLEKMENQFAQRPQRAIITGGGLIGIELAEMWASRGTEVTMLIRENSYWTSGLPKEESELVQEYLIQKGLRFVTGDRLSSLQLTNNKLTGIYTTNGQLLNCDLLGITIGVEPNVQWLSDSGLQINRGVLVDDYLKTNDPHIYAGGDCAELRSTLAHRKNIEAVWYVGRKMGHCIAENIAGNTTPYDQGLWFNSARFFDLGYQIYGNIEPCQPYSGGSFFWKHRSQLKTIRIFMSGDRTLQGMLALGVNLRQEVCERWIKERLSLEEVLTRFSEVAFDGEFTEDPGAALRKQYQREFHTSLPEKKKALGSLLWFKSLL